MEHPPCPSVPTALSRRRGVTLFSNGILIDIAARHDLEPTASPLQQKLHFDLRMSFQKLESQPFWSQIWTNVIQLFTIARTFHNHLWKKGGKNHKIVGPLRLKYDFITVSAHCVSVCAHNSSEKTRSKSCRTPSKNEECYFIAFIKNFFSCSF